MSDKTTLARPYAKAVFELARDSKQLDQWSTDLAALAVVVNDERISQLLAYPGVSDEEKAAVVADSLEGKLAAGGAQLVHVLAENKRLPLIPEIASLYDAHRAALESSVEVNIETAFEMETTLAESLAKSLERALKRKVTLHTQVNKSLIGGVVIRAGDTVIDASVKGRLQKLAEVVSA